MTTQTYPSMTTTTTQLSLTTTTILTSSSSSMSVLLCGGVGGCGGGRPKTTLGCHYYRPEKRRLDIKIHRVLEALAHTTHRFIPLGQLPCLPERVPIAQGHTHATSVPKNATPSTQKVFHSDPL